MSKRARRLALIILCLSALVLLCACGAADTDATETADAAETARPSVNGRLHAEGSHLTDAAGQAVHLRGLSTHGLTWYPEMISENLFRQVSDDWNCNLIRLAMYSSDYCTKDGRDRNLELMRKGIEAAIAADTYVLVDWHILSDFDPNENKDGAKEFFDLIASEMRPA